MSLKIAIVAVDLRAAWLALELKKLSFDVTYLDLSSSLPRPTSEDIEGPFGHFVFDSWDSSFFDLLQFEEPIHPQPQGFVTWTAQGPLEYKSDLFAIKAKYVNPLVHRLVHDFNRTQVIDHVQKKSADLALQNRFTFRNYNRNSISRIQERLRESLDYHNQIQLRDLSFKGRHKVSGIELDGDIKGHQNYDFVVWALTEDENKFLSEKLHSQLPRRKKNEKLYVWVPFIFKLEKTAEFEALPDHFFVIQDENLQFNQENIFVFKKSLAAQQYQVWSLVSFSQQYNPNYLNLRAQQIEKVMNEKAPRIKFSLYAMPGDLTKSTEERVPFGYYVWSADSDLPQSTFENLFVCGPDTWYEYSWFESWSKQKSILEAIKAEDEKRKRKNKKQDAEAEA